MTDGTGLRVALLTYRGTPFRDGQGIYVRHLSRELHRLGHEVTGASGPPYPTLDHGVQLERLPSLDLYREPDPFRMPRRVASCGGSIAACRHRTYREAPAFQWQPSRRMRNKAAAIGA